VTTIGGPERTRTTQDPRIRLSKYGSRCIRTEVRDEPGGDWDITGPVYLTWAQARAAVDDVRADYFGELPGRGALVLRIEQLEREAAGREAELAVARQMRNAAADYAGRLRQAIARHQAALAHEADLFASHLADIDAAHAARSDAISGGRDGAPA
jgi:hypothetical protein